MGGVPVGVPLGVGGVPSLADRSSREQRTGERAAYRRKQGIGESAAYRRERSAQERERRIEQSAAYRGESSV